MKYTLNGFAQFTGKHLITPDRAKMKVAPFQRTVLGDHFAGVTEELVILPKKNGKTSILAGLGIYHLLAIPDPDVVVVANSSTQAMKLFDEARGFIQRSPFLSERLRVLRGYKEIRVKDPKDPDNPKKFVGTLKVLAADADTADGWGGTLALIDELHRAKDSELYGVLYDGLGPRSGQLITISTAGENEDSPLGDLRAKAYAMPGLKRKGCHRYVTDGAFSMHEWALDPTDDPEDLDLVESANPAPWMTKRLLAQRRHSPGMTAARWARFACGIWGIGGEPAFDVAKFAALEGGETPEPGAKIALGFDGARRKDGTALVGCCIRTGHLFMLGYWQKPPDADDSWEVPEDEVDQMVDYAFTNWEVVKFNGDPPFWESALDRWAGDYGKEIVVRWWTNRIKATAIAIRGFVNDMAPGRMSHDGDADLLTAIRNAIRRDTKMEEDGQVLFVITKPSKNSAQKIDAAMGAILAWRARGDAIALGALEEEEHEVAQW